MDVHETTGCERGNNFVGRSGREDVWGMSKSIHPFLRKESNDQATTRRQHTMDLGEAGVE